MKPNSLTIVVKWLAFQEVPGSDLNPETNYTDKVLLIIFLSLSRQMLW